MAFRPTLIRTIIALTVVGLIPMTVPSTVANHAVPSTMDIELEQGNVTVVQGSSRTFVDDGTISVRAIVSNVGAMGQPADVPVWFQLKDPVTSGVLKQTCILKRFESGTREAPNTHTLYWNFTIDDQLAPADVGYNITVSANHRPAGAANAGCSNSETANVFHAEVEDQPNVVADHVATGHFVKGKRVDYKVNWIRWCINNDATCDGTMLEGPGQPYNFSRIPGPGAVPIDTFFEINITNVGTWQYDHDHGRQCANSADCGFAFDLDVSAEYEDTGEIVDLDPVGAEQFGADNVYVSGALNFTGHTGNISLTAQIMNLTQVGPERDNDVLTQRFEIKSFDIVGAFNATNLNTTPQDPYPYTGRPTIEGWVTITAPGSIAPQHDIDWTIYIDRPGADPAALTGPCQAIPSAQIACSGTIPAGTLAPGAAVHQRFRFIGETVVGDTDYLRPGKHTIYLSVDNGVPAPGATYGRNFETNETNNLVAIDIYVQDASPPVIENPRLVFFIPGQQGGQQAHDEPVDTLNPHKRFSVRAEVTDNDINSVQVFANFTNVENTSVSRLYPMSFGANRYSVQIDDLPMYGTGRSTNWSVTVHANDAFNNATKFARTVRVDQWDIQLQPKDYIVLSPANGTVFPWGTNFEFSMQVRANATGIKDQKTDGSNIKVHVESPDGYNHTHEDTDILVPSASPSSIECQAPPAGVGPEECTEAWTFKTLINTRDGAPGVWNASIRVADLAGQIRYVNRTFIMQDLIPTIEVANVTTVSYAATDSVAAGSNVKFGLNVTDDFDEIPPIAYVNLTRAQGGTYNFSFGEPRTIAIGEGDVAHLYELNFTTGRGKVLGEGGNYTATFAVMDQNKNWRTVGPKFLNVTDSFTPTLDAGSGVVGSTHEIKLPITWTAKASDETNVSVFIEVLKGSENIISATKMEEAPDGNFTYTATFNDACNCVWKMYAVDSMGKRSNPPLEGPLSVFDNLGPRFEIRAPSVVIEGQRYGRAEPRIEVLVYDTDGVDPSSITLLINGEEQTVRPIFVASPVAGYLVSADPDGRFEHRERVVINLTAIDNSTKQLMGWQNLTFVVDDVAPVAKHEVFTPAYRDSDLDEWNVSFDTQFRLKAEDDDGVDHRSLSIRVRVYPKTGNSVEEVYTGPFRLKDYLGKDARPGAYTIQYFAEDDVGNVNTTRQTIHVYVDDTAPYYYQFGPEPKNQFINVSLKDDRSGVKRAVVFYKLNNQTYTSVPMNYTDGIWTAVLPEGRKGDKVSYYLQVWDQVDNSDKIWADDPRSYVAPNHAPTATIAFPAEGDTLNRQITIRYSGADSDGDALEFLLELLGPDGKFGELTEVKAPTPGAYSGQFVFDTARHPDGDYKLRIRVSDGSEFKFVERSFSILNKATAIHTWALDGEGLQAGTTTKAKTGIAELVEVQLTKADVRRVEAVVLRGGSEVKRVSLYDDGQNGDKALDDQVYSGYLQLDEPGDYQLRISTEYVEGGETKTEETPPANLRVDPTGIYIASSYGFLVAGIAIAGVAAAGVATWAVLRRR